MGTKDLKNTHYERMLGSLRVRSYDPNLGEFCYLWLRGGDMRASANTPGDSNSLCRAYRGSKSACLAFERLYGDGRTARGKVCLVQQYVPGMYVTTVVQQYCR